MTAAASLGVDSRLKTPDSRLGLRPAKPLAIAARPRITAHVIAAFFPVARLVVFEKAHALDPLCRFPGIKLGNDQTHRATVFRRYRLSVMRPREERIFVQEKLNRNICGPAVIVAKRQHKFCFGFDAGYPGDLSRCHATPNVIQSRPARDAMK